MGANSLSQPTGHLTSRVGQALRVENAPQLIPLLLGAGSSVRYTDPGGLTLVTLTGGKKETSLGRGLGHVTGRLVGCLGFTSAGQRPGTQSKGQAKSPGSGPSGSGLGHWWMVGRLSEAS